MGRSKCVGYSRMKLASTTYAQDAIATFPQAWGTTCVFLETLLTCAVIGTTRAGSANPRAGSRAYSEGVFQDLHVRAKHTRCIESDSSDSQALQHVGCRCQEILSSAANTTLLFWRDRLEWVPEVTRAPRLHLDHGENSVAKRHHIELSALGAKVSGDDMPTTSSILSGDEVFAPSPTGLS